MMDATRANMAKTQQTSLVTDLLEMAAGVVEELQEEMTEWQSNMEGANMDHLPKYEQVSECVDALENSEVRNRVDAMATMLGTVCQPPKGDTAGLPALDLDSLTASYIEHTKKRKSRADRLGDAQQYLAAAVDALDARLDTLREADKARLAELEREATGAESEEDPRLEEVETALAEVREAMEWLEGVEFPGMFG
jgi:hypothetical protein